MIIARVTRRLPTIAGILWYLPLLRGLGLIKPARLIEELPENSLILFVCTGNICRSPYAAERLRALLEINNPRNLRVGSVGLETTSGKAADPQAIAVARPRAALLETHRTAQLTAELAAEAGILLLMDRRHRRLVNERFADALPRSVFLGWFGNPRSSPWRSAILMAAATTSSAKLLIILIAAF